MTNSISQDAALWKCESCGSWWCSQPALAPTDFLHQLPPALAATLPWDEFRGWAVGSPGHVAACLECDIVSPNPLYGTAGEATRLQPMFALHAASRMSVRNMRQPGFPSTAAH
jgi:hypothetical protein